MKGENEHTNFKRSMNSNQDKQNKHKETLKPNCIKTSTILFHSCVESKKNKINEKPKQTDGYGK